MNPCYNFQVHMKSADAEGALVSIEVDFNDKWMDIYLVGSLFSLYQPK